MAELEPASQASELVNHLVTRGALTLEEPALKRIKEFCKTGEDNIKLVHSALWANLEKEHAQLADVLFQRSHVFRTLLLAHFAKFLQLTVGIHQHKLPSPKDWASKLKSVALSTVRGWEAKFGGAYKQLSVGVNYLKEHPVAAGGAIGPSTVTVLDREARGRLQRIEKYKKAVEEMDSHNADILEEIEELNTCVELLPAEASGTASSSTAPEVLDNATQETNESRLVIMETLRECYHALVRKHLPRVLQWVTTISKADDDDKPLQDANLRRAIDLKRGIEEAKGRADHLGLVLEPRRSSLDTDAPGAASSPPSKDVKARSESPSALTQKGKRKWLLDGSVEGDVAAAFNRISTPEEEEETKNGKNKESADVPDEMKALYESAPVVEYGNDLYYWDKKEVLFNTSGFEIQHRFMGTGDGNTLMPESMLKELRKRKRFIEGKLPDDIPPCNAPLKDGRLCPRRDLRECPIHGPKIPRDEHGEPLAPASSSSSSEPRAPWQIAEEEVRKILEMRAEVTRLGEEEEEKKRKRRKKRKEGGEWGNLVDLQGRKEPGPMERVRKLVEGKAMREKTERVEMVEEELRARDRRVNRW
ncbi:hypothetical protein HDV00_002022 [Rhizophlyctis rosea]|nr:hypothetical protein HDV00_002022 [Rhizophlyctis rosea]